MTWTRVLLYPFLIAQLCLYQNPAWGDIAQTSRAQNERKLANAMFDFIAAQSMLVKSAADFERIFLTGFRPDDRAEILIELRRIKKIPSLQRIGETLMTTDGLRRVDLKWPNPRKVEFQINGIPFAYDPNKNLIPQLEAIQGKMASNSHAPFLFDQILPSANAMELKGMLAVSVVAGAVGSLLSGPLGELGLAMFCSEFRNYPRCLDAKKTERAALLAKAPKFDAVFNQTATDKQNILTKFQSEDWACPSENNGKDREYRGRIRQVQMIDGKPQPIGDFIEVEGKLDPKGVPTDFIFSKINSDPKTLNDSTIEGAKNLVAHVAFDPTELKPLSYRVRNPDFGREKPLAAATKVLDRSMTLTSEESESMNTIDDMITYLNYQNYKCVEKKVTDDQKKGVDSGSPVAPKKANGQPDTTSDAKTTN